MGSIIWSLGAFVVTLGILVTFHEFGHFWVARRCGVKVLTFSVGFGKPIWQRQGRDGTVYQVGVIPLGGYVRMLDERVDSVSENERQVTFNSKTVWQRAAIIAAGPIANFVLAIAVLWLMFVIGVPSVKPIVGTVQENSIAAQAGIQTPAEIIAIDGVETADWQQVNLRFAAALGNDLVEVKTIDDGNRERTYQLQIGAWRLQDNKQPTYAALGLQPFRPEVSLVLSYIAPDSPAAAANLQVGDKIIAFDGTPVVDWPQTRDLIMQAAGQEVRVTLERNGQTVTQQVQLGSREANGQRYGFLGVEPTVAAYPEQYRFTQQYGIVDGLLQGAERTWELMALSVNMLGKLLVGTVSVSNLSGPVAIAEGAGATASYGLVYFLGFLALISVNLGIINLVPLPVLDGGHLAFLAIEGVRGKPVSERVQEVCYRIGGILIFALMAIAISNDILRLSQ
ncbi:sigma E protease regulator RseP [Pseudidiomarina donghaiensis]|uniref:Zinc metalloprotease n=1 Tax=Pseudidiomarina donghaiensis TaxID=519452 RepID=A0A432XM29_9GAMM|nr:sigma E protease regulator RseP [Pseudidiomarina donghaiensis]RUO49756.1 sigma E protease regulator RseP [Pseudidiomarina donghaiensis]SFV21791.1 regulator of sigma E protease [Pseudidiomarina donghaiensis]